MGGAAVGGAAMGGVAVWGGVGWGEVGVGEAAVIGGGTGVGGAVHLPPSRPPASARPSALPCADAGATGCPRTGPAASLAARWPPATLASLR